MKFLETIGIEILVVLGIVAVLWIGVRGLLFLVDRSSRRIASQSEHESQADQQR